MITELKGGDLHRSVIISLFSWARASNSDPIDDSERHGWWGDSFSNTGAIGSKLWLLRRRKFDRSLLQDAKSYASDALKWLVTEGHVDEVVVEATRVGIERLHLLVKISIGQQEYHVNFDDLMGVIRAV